MSTRAFRKVVIALLVSTTLAAATGAAPSQALSLRPHRNVEDPARTDSPRGLFASLLHYFFELAGGAMDPNGSH
ncbi:MAG: hypothetical protein ABIS20_11555 [Thermoanaerobaculia bacterium]